ncbi:MAG: hypothetical protein HY525_08190 [Betaproteobacteria bacterium]|nr:hypothetical protein [Betaproteobacteria bacterium]
MRPQSSPTAPSLPTVAEPGYPGFDIKNWFGIFVSAGTPRENFDALYKEVARAVLTPEVKERLAGEGGG